MSNKTMKDIFDEIQKNRDQRIFKKLISQLDQIEYIKDKGKYYSKNGPDYVF